MESLFQTVLQTSPTESLPLKFHLTMSLTPELLLPPLRLYRLRKSSKLIYGFQFFIFTLTAPHVTATNLFLEIKAIFRHDLRIKSGESGLQIIRRLSLGHLRSHMHLLRRKCVESPQFSAGLKAASWEPEYFKSQRFSAAGSFPRPCHRRKAGANDPRLHFLTFGNIINDSTIKWVNPPL